MMCLCPYLSQSFFLFISLLCTYKVIVLFMHMTVLFPFILLSHFSYAMSFSESLAISSSLLTLCCHCLLFSLLAVSLSSLLTLGCVILFSLLAVSLSSLFTLGYVSIFSSHSLLCHYLLFSLSDESLSASSTIISSPLVCVLCHALLPQSFYLITLCVHCFHIYLFSLFIFKILIVALSFFAFLLSSFSNLYFLSSLLFGIFTAEV